MLRKQIGWIIVVGCVFGLAPTASAASDADNASACLGAVYAETNSNGGELEKGAFGAEQREHAREERAFGHELQTIRTQNCLRLNQVQVLGTHNSYHIQPAPSLSFLIALQDPDLAASLEYTHAPLAEELAVGVRQIELDVFVDPDGGLYANPLGPIVVAANGLPPGPDFDPEARMLAPGFKVLHIQDIDFRSTCLLLTDCLETLRAWSDANPGHLPLMVLIEAKDDPIPLDFSVIPIPFGPAEFDALDAEIRSVLSADRLITPDDVRGDHASLEDAILTEGWPTLRKSRGRMLFALDNGGAKRDTYVAGHPALAGRVLFTNSAPGEPEAGFVKLNNPVGSFEQIQQRVLEGYIVRTRADADTVQARTGDPTRRDAALASGAQYVSTDYPAPEANPFGTGYFVEIPEGAPARCNPLNAPPWCTNDTLEDLD